MLPWHTICGNPCCSPKYYMMMPMMRMMIRIMITVVIIQITLLLVSYFFFYTTFYCSLFFFLSSFNISFYSHFAIYFASSFTLLYTMMLSSLYRSSSVQLDFFLYCLVQILHSVTPASPGCNANGIGTWTQNCVTLWKSSALICIMSWYKFFVS